MHRSLLVGLLACLVLNARADSPDAAPALHHGINLGNMLEAPHEGEWGEVVHEDYFSIIRQAGFDFVRAPIRWSAHVAAGPDFTLDPAFVQHID